MPVPFPPLQKPSWPPVYNGWYPFPIPHDASLTDMDAWQRTTDQWRALLRGLSAMQRATLFAVALGVLAGMGWLVLKSTSPSTEFLLGGKSFSPDELRATQSALKAAGLTQFQIVGQRISVPAAATDQYTAAAIARQTLPAQFAAEFDRMQSKVNVFTSSEQRRELLEEARKTRLAQILRSIPEIEEAIVDWDRPRQTNLFRPAPQVAAHVSVKPRDGRELTPELIRSLKLFVAGALAGAQTDDVTVVDMNTSRVYGRQSPAAAAAEQLQGLVKQHEAEYSSQIARTLSYIPDLLVTVKVTSSDTDVDEVSDAFLSPDIVPASRRLRGQAQSRQSKSQQRQAYRAEPVAFVRAARGYDLDHERSSLDHDSELIDLDGTTAGGDAIAAVQVTVSIPETYYTEIAHTRGFSAGDSLVDDSAFRAALASIKAETQHDVREKLSRVLPDGTHPRAISITSYTPRKSVSANTDLPSTASAESTIGVDQDQLKLGLGIGICAACAVCCLLWLRPRRGPLVVATLEDESRVISAPLIETALNQDDTYPPATVHPHAALLEELAELERRVQALPSARATPFDFFADIAVRDAARLLQSEHPQTIALVATALTPATAAAILHALPQSLCSDVTHRLTRIGVTAPDILQEVAASLKQRWMTATQAEEPPLASADVPPLPFAPSPVSDVASATHHESFTFPQSGVSDVDLIGPMTFDDLGTLDIRSLTTVLESIDLRACAVALLDRSEAFKQMLFSAMPKQVATAVRQHFRQLGPVRLVEITASQQDIADVAWNLAQHGMITLPAHLQSAA